MPTITNKQTGQKYKVSDDGLRKIQDNPLTSDLYTYAPPAGEPEEVTEARTRKANKADAVTAEEIARHAEIMAKAPQLDAAAAAAEIIKSKEPAAASKKK